MSDDTTIRTRMEALYHDVLGDVAVLVEQVTQLKAELSSIVSIVRALQERQFTTEPAILEEFQQSLQELSFALSTTMSIEFAKLRPPVDPSSPPRLHPGLEKLFDERISRFESAANSIKHEFGQFAGAQAAIEKRKKMQLGWGGALTFAIVMMGIFAFGIGWYMRTYLPMSAEERRLMVLGANVESRMSELTPATQKWIRQLGK